MNINSLQDKINENHELSMIDPYKAFVATDILLKEAIISNDNVGELTILGRQCWYYNYSLDIDNLIRTAKLLEKKAVQYKDRRFQAIAHNYLISAYTVINLEQKAILEFDKVIAILKKEDEKDPFTILEKFNAYTYLANLYFSRKEYEKALPYLISSSKEIEKYEDTKRKREIQYRNYSNIAVVYLNIDLEKAEYYIEKSMSLKPENYPHNEPITFLNYSLLGDLNRLRKNYKEALTYYKEAEKIIPENITNDNKVALFKGLMESYETLSDTINTNIYLIKLKESELEISKNKNKSLYTLLKEQKENNPIYIYVLVVFLIIMAIIIFFVIRKNKILARQEKASREYLEKLSENSSGEDYSRLLKALKENDSAFMFYFEETFPNFSEKLLQINPKISPSETEFCALLKIKIPTKDIARYKFIEPQSVRNKKSVIRKKLNIPTEIDIYKFIDEL